MAMNPEIKAKWVAALRSGDYAQGRLRLRNARNEFCCLGVLCDAIDPQGWSYCEDSPTHRSCTSEPVPHLRQAWRLNEESLGILMGMNDGERKTFAEISDYIEENL